MRRETPLFGILNGIPLFMKYKMSKKYKVEKFIKLTRGWK